MSHLCLKSTKRHSADLAHPSKDPLKGTSEQRQHYSRPGPPVFPVVKELALCSLLPPLNLQKEDLESG